MIFTTSICANYGNKAAALACSIKNFHPESKFILCLLERSIPCELRNIPYFDEIILGSELKIDHFENFIFRHSIVEASTAVKGHLMDHLMNNYLDTEKFVYIDPDCLAFSRFEELIDILDKNEIVLTPHLLSPGNISMEISSLKHGIYNLGFLGLKRGETSSAFCKWWANRLNTHCFDDICNGLFTDQKWVNLASCFFDIHTFKHAGYNFGTWNFLERSIQLTPTNMFVANEQPLRFVHFSGFDRGTFSWAASKWAPDKIELAEKLSSIYSNKVSEFPNTRSIPWSYSVYSNQRKIKNWHRVSFRAFPEDARNPFDMHITTKFKLWKIQLKYFIKKMALTALRSWR